MRHDARSAHDATGEAAARNLIADSVYSSVLARIENEFDRAVILRHWGLEIPLASLARDLGTSPRELEERLRLALTELRRDAGLADELADIRHAGQLEDYHALIIRLNMESWFCAQCARPIVQRGVGRPRKTCSVKCRRLLHQAKGIGWREQYFEGSHEDSYERGLDRRATDIGALRVMLLHLMNSIDTKGPAHWRHPGVSSRNRAMLLLGLTCPTPLSAEELVTLDVNDVHKTVEGMEIRLYKQAARRTQYVKVSAGDDPQLCAVNEVLSWRKRLLRSGKTTGPLFVEMDREGNFTQDGKRVSSQEVAQLTREAFWWASGVHPPFRPTGKFIDLLSSWPGQGQESSEICGGAYFVQFHQPSRENATRGDLIPWNTGRRRAKFLISDGRYLASDGKLASGELAFWGNWEPPSIAQATWPLSGNLPRVLHRPFWFTPTGVQSLQNTDPWVFGDRMLYSNHMQTTRNGAARASLQNLVRGSVICFGANIGFRFCVETVFVVASAETWIPEDSDDLGVGLPFKPALRPALPPVILQLQAN